MYFVRYSLKARDAEARGDEAGRRSNACIALGCNVFAFVWWIFAVAGVVLLVLFIPREICTNDYYYDNFDCYTYTLG